MTLCLNLEDIQKHHAPMTGGKAFALSLLLQRHFAVPDSLCILADAVPRDGGGFPGAVLCRTS